MPGDRHSSILPPSFSRNGLVSAFLGCDYLSFAGAGVGAVCYVGALNALRDLGGEKAYSQFSSRLRGASGTSSGSLLAFAFASGVSLDASKAICDAFAALDFASAPDLARAPTSLGLCSPDALNRAIDACLSACGFSSSLTLSRLRDLTKRELVICATDLNAMEPVYLSAETTPDMRVRDALYCSMCLPIVFPPLRFGDRLLCDGLLVDNLPCPFDPARTAAMQTTPSPASPSISDWKQLLFSVVLTPSRRRTRSSMPSFAAMVGVDPLLADPVRVAYSEREMQHLLARGYAAVLAGEHADVPPCIGAVVQAVALCGGTQTHSEKGGEEGEEGREEGGTEVKDGERGSEEEREEGGEEEGEESEQEEEEGEESGQEAEEEGEEEG